MSVNLIKYTPKTGDYVYVTRRNAPLTAGRVANVFPHESTVSVCPAGSTRYIYASYAQLSEHPQNRWGETEPTPAPQSGYTPCACRDCMDITVSSDMAQPELCSECADAGCEIHVGPEPTIWHPGVECQREDAYED